MRTSDRTATVTLPADDEIFVTREFDAPPALMYRAWTTPELVRRWWHGGHGRLTVVEIDLRVGGRWRYAMDAGEGQEVAFNGEFLELEPGARIVNTEAYEAMPDTGAAVVTTTFRPAPTGTLLEMLIKMPDKDSRDGMLAYGMEDGMQQQMALLDEIAAELA